MLRRGVIIGTAFLLLMTGEVSAEPDFGLLADCVHRIENGTWPPVRGQGEEYGIHSCRYKDSGEARAICIRTIKHSWRDNPTYEALARRYCPKHWQHWLKMFTAYAPKLSASSR